MGWKELSHPNVLPFLGISEAPSQFAIISPWLPNGDIINHIWMKDLRPLYLVSDHRISAHEPSENSILNSLPKLPAASNTCIHKALYTVALLR